MSPLLNSKKKDSAPSSATKAKKPSKLFSGNKTWFIFAIVSAVAAAAIIFGVLSQVVATTTYYVLGQNVAARSHITPDMLKEVTTSQGGQPRNALTIGQLTKDTVAKYDLAAGDIITQSNTGTFQPLSQGIPADYVVASFSADAKNAVAGKLASGNYVDLIAVSAGNAQSVAKYVLRHVLVMDVSADPSTIGSNSTSSSTTAAAGTDPNAAPAQPKSAQDKLRTGIPSLYTVALPPADAAKLALIKDSPIMVVLSPAAFKDNTGFSDQNIQSTQGEVFSDTPVGNSGAKTDPTFGQTSASKTPAAAAAPSASPSATPSAAASDTPSATPKPTSTSSK